MTPTRYGVPVSLILAAVVLGCGERSTSRRGDVHSAAPEAGASKQLAGNDSGMLDRIPDRLYVGGRIEADVADTGPTHTVHGACPFECCQYGRWVLRGGAVLRSRPERDAEAIGTLTRGDSLTADSGVVVFQPTGLVIMLATVKPTFEDSIVFEKGDTVELFAETGEGWRNVRWRGQELNANVDDWSFPTTRFQVVRRPHSRWWVFVTHPGSGRRGWLDMTDVAADGADRCG